MTIRPTQRTEFDQRTEFFFFFFFIHLGYSLNFTDVYPCHITRGIPPPGGGIVGENRSTRSKTTVRRERVGPLGSRWGPLLLVPYSDTFYFICVLFDSVLWHINCLIALHDFNFVYHRLQVLFENKWKGSGVQCGPLLVNFFPAFHHRSILLTVSLLVFTLPISWAYTFGYCLYCLLFLGIALLILVDWVKPISDFGHSSDG